MQPGMYETIARQYEIAGIKPLQPWPRVNEMGEHAMVQKVKYRLEKGTDYSRLLQVFSTCVNLRREFRSWKYLPAMMMITLAVLCIASIDDGRCCCAGP
jgi:hypothetical protein